MKIVAIVFLIVLTIASFFFVFSKTIARFIEKKKYRKRVYKILYKYARDHDYMLLNKMALQIENKVIHFDHLLFTNKFIYCIVDAYYNGPLKGKFNDQKWFKYDKNGKFTHINNPMLLNRVRVNYLAGFMSASQDLFVELLVINDSCLIDNIDDLTEMDAITHIKDLKKTITKFEERNVAQIDSNQLELVVERLYKKGIKQSAKE